MITPAAQLVTHLSFSADWLTFRKNTDRLKQGQQHVLQKMLQLSETDFQKAPLRTYTEQLELIRHSGQKIIRRQPTSGSGEKEKLIPYTAPFLQELNRGLSPWLFDLARQHPGLLKGKHYWSLSWLPTHWRDKGWDLDDFELLPRWKKELTRVLMAVPNEVSRARTLPASQFATLAYLGATEELTFLSVWSPTFLLQLLTLLQEWESPLRETLRTGRWALFQEELASLKAPLNLQQAKRLPDVTRLWPKLCVVSSWDSGTSAPWASKLQEAFPGAAFQGKGLWATEGVVTVPFENQFLLSYLSHYYEFLELSSGKLLNSWELREGMEVHPVLTTGNGFVRYHLKDRLVVTGYRDQVPALQFLERDETFDLVGEKLDAHCFSEISGEMKKMFPDLLWVIAFAVNPALGKPYYHFLFEGKGDVSVMSSLKNLLKQRFHYQLARELGQLGEERISILTEGFAAYQNFQLARGMVQGNIKMELATFIRTKENEAIYHEHFPH